MLTFKVNSGKLQIIDPRFNPGIWCSAVVPVKNGTWIAETNKINDGEWGDRITNLTVFHDSVYPHKNRLRFVWRDSNIGCDSGMAGIFDSQPFIDIKTNIQLDMEFTHQCDAMTFDVDNLSTLPYGAVSKTGFGGGVYSLFTAQSGNETVAAKILFINEADQAFEEH